MTPDEELELAPFIDAFAELLLAEDRRQQEEQQQANKKPGVGHRAEGGTE